MKTAKAASKCINKMCNSFLKVIHMNQTIKLHKIRVCYETQFEEYLKQNPQITPNMYRKFYKTQIYGYTITGPYSELSRLINLLGIVGQPIVKF